MQNTHIPDIKTKFKRKNPQTKQKHPVSSIAPSKTPIYFSKDLKTIWLNVEGQNHTKQQYFCLKPETGKKASFILKSGISKNIIKFQKKKIDK